MSSGICSGIDISISSNLGFNVSNGVSSIESNSDRSY